MQSETLDKSCNKFSPPALFFHLGIRHYLNVSYSAMASLPSWASSTTLSIMACSLVSLLILSLPHQNSCSRSPKPCLYSSQLLVKFSRGSPKLPRLCITWARGCFPKSTPLCRRMHAGCRKKDVTMWSNINIGVVYLASGLKAGYKELYHRLGGRWSKDNSRVKQQKWVRHATRSFPHMR